jgi:hypothetical protein
MAAFTTSATADASAKTGSSPAYVVDIKEKFAFRVLDNDGDHLASGRVTHLAGERLIAQVSEYLKPNTCIRIDCDDAFLLGESLDCWREGLTTFAAVKLLQSLTGLEQLASRDEYWDSPHDL